jgi:hypothetical protein
MKELKDTILSIIEVDDLNPLFHDQDIKVILAEEFSISEIITALEIRQHIELKRIENNYNNYTKLSEIILDIVDDTITEIIKDDWYIKDE